MAFVKSNYIKSFSDNKYASVSRTDRGVNAIMNCFVLEMDVYPNLKIINANIKESLPLIIYDYAPVESEFHPRKVTSKLYRYFLDKNLISLSNLYRLRKFIGHNDFFSFIKPDGAGAVNSMTVIHDIRISESNNYYIININGDKFGREQIRRMIGFLFDRRFTDKDPEVFLNIRNEILSIKPVSPQFLILISIEFPVELNWIGHIDLGYIWERFQNFSSNESLQTDVKLSIVNELLGKTTNKG